MGIGLGWGSANGQVEILRGSAHGQVEILCGSAHGQVEILCGSVTALVTHGWQASLTNCS